MFLWSPIAQASYLQTLIYLSENQSKEVAIHFNQQVEQLLSDIDSLSKKALRFSIYYRYTINKFCTITYVPTSDIVEIVAFYDSRLENI